MNDKAREELFSEVNGLSDEDINKKPSEDQWSIKQIIEHLILMEGAVTQMVTDQLKNGEIVNADHKPIESTLIAM
ncbi:DinB family protein [Lederbergia galactosidilytica]|uniref:DinB family protein n=1 Tax=Lederbergia galactosidilytica TaxID=217031 RepID=UPI0009EE2AC2|nr:DinB family protein [Lederbergia galactosidilytica]